MYLDLNSKKRKAPQKPRAPSEINLNEEIKEKGFARIWSENLGIEVVWVRDESIAKKFKGETVFTLKELKKLKGYSVEELKDYTLKKIFDATEVERDFLCTAGEQTTQKG